MKNNSFLLMLCFAIKSVFCGLVVLLALSPSLWAVEASAQIRNINEVDINIQFKDAHIEKVFKAIEDQTEFVFVYAPEDLKDVKLVNLSMRKKSVSEVLEAISKQSHLQFLQIQQNISVRKEEPKGTSAILHQEDAGAQSRIVSGKITSFDDSEGIPGANVIVKGTTHGTVTDVEGNYTITVSSPEDVLVISFVGYITEEVVVGAQSVIDISLMPDITALDEIVVVGYGEQKKINLTGAIDQVSAAQIERNLGGNTSQVIQGLIPNMNVSFNNGGINEEANINVRGVGSINGGDPLVLIDGVEGNMNNINPKDIKSITVLKDAASASIYGARASFGVILITTKEARSGDIQVNYNGNFGWSTPTIRTDNFITDGLEWARLSDKLSLLENSSTYLGYSEEDYAYMEQRRQDPSLPSVLIKTVDGVERYVHYGNTDWWDQIFSDVQPSTEHNINLSGGSEKVNFYLSGRYYKRKGIYKINPDELESYTLRAKIDAKPTKWLDIGNSTNIYVEDYTYPATNTRNVSGNNNNEDWRKYTFHASPIFNPTNPDGSLIINGPYTPGNDIADGTFADLMYGKSKGRDNEVELTNTISAKAKVLENLDLHGNYTFRTSSPKNWVRLISSPYTNQPDGEGVSLYKENKQVYKERHWENLYQAFNAYANYSFDINNKHYFSGVVGFNQEWRKWKRLIVRRNGNLSEDLNSFNLATGEDMQIESNADEWAIRAGFYRIKYDYEGKYLVEFNGRYDLSSKFPSKSRAGFFPSASVAWRISEERFFDGLSPYVNNFKVRASYGMLGNQNVGPYDYIARMSVNTSNYIVDGTKINYLTSPNPVSSNFTWERSSTLNLGVDMGFFHNRLTATYDWFERNTYDMLTQGKQLPSVFGASEPKENAADLSTKGFEVSLKWQDETTVNGKPLVYNIGFNVADSKTTITKFDNPDGQIDQFYEGKVLGEVWGYTVEGFFQSDNEYLEHADQTLVNDRIQKNYLINHPVAGDIKFKDLDGDGKITPGDKTIYNPGDLKIIGNTSPRYSYSFNLGASYSGFDFSVFMQGILKQSWAPGHDNSFFWGPFTRQYNNFYPKSIVEDTWSPENPDAYFPRLAVYAANGHNDYEGAQLRVNSDKYLQNAGYLRLKNVTVGYTLQDNIWPTMPFSKVRVYASGANLLTFSQIYKHNKDRTIDPEQLGNGNAYPFSKTYVVGIDITF